MTTQLDEQRSATPNAERLLLEELLRRTESLRESAADTVTYNNKIIAGEGVWPATVASAAATIAQAAAKVSAYDEVIRLIHGMLSLHERQ